MSYKSKQDYLDEKEDMKMFRNIIKNNMERFGVNYTCRTRDVDVCNTLPQVGIHKPISDQIYIENEYSISTNIFSLYK